MSDGPAKYDLILTSITSVKTKNYFLQGAVNNLEHKYLANAMIQLNVEANRYYYAGLDSAGKAKYTPTCYLSTDPASGTVYRDIWVIIIVQFNLFEDLSVYFLLK